MEISVSLDNGYLADKYTKHASDSEKIDGSPVISFPIEIKDVPEGTQTLALTLLDYDDIPVDGFTWIHWIAANMPADITEIPEDNSQKLFLPMIQGKNSTAGKYFNNENPVTSAHYAGPYPPVGTHNYELTLYALDTTLDLKDGFWLNELRDAMKDHMIDGARISFPVKA